MVVRFVSVRMVSKVIQRKDALLIHAEIVTKMPFVRLAVTFMVGVPVKNVSARVDTSEMESKNAKKIHALSAHPMLTATMENVSADKVTMETENNAKKTTHAKDSFNIIQS